MEALRAPHPNEPRGARDLERTLKWMLLLPILFLRKPPSNNGTKAKELKSIIQRRLDQHDLNDWKGLIADYEKDVVLAQTVHRDDNRTEDIKDETKIRKAADLLSRFQCSKARKCLQSNGLGDHTEESIVEQMKRKHPARKKPITPLTEEELQAPRKGIDRDVFRKRLSQLKHDIAPGLGCLRNEHLLALLLNPDRQMTPSAAAAVDHLHDYANAAVQVQMPQYFYTVFVGCRLVLANKINPKDLPPNTAPDCRPVNIGRAD